MDWETITAAIVGIGAAVPILAAIGRVLLRHILRGLSIYTGAAAAQLRSGPKPLEPDIPPGDDYRDAWQAWQSGLISLEDLDRAVKRERVRIAALRSGQTTSTSPEAAPGE